jgi:hypothetical protein
MTKPPEGPGSHPRRTAPDTPISTQAIEDIQGSISDTATSKLNEPALALSKGYEYIGSDFNPYLTFHDCLGKPVMVLTTSGEEHEVTLVDISRREGEEDFTVETQDENGNPFNPPSPIIGIRKID